MKIAPIDLDLYSKELEGGEGFGPKKPGDAGIDLRSRETVEVPKGKTVAIPLGVAVELDFREVGWLTGRSTTALSYDILTHEGKIDSGYRGTIHCVCTALTRDVKVSRGERICQLVVVLIMPPTMWEIADFDDLSETERGALGLGSSGRI